MQRDMELVRKILLKMEETPIGQKIQIEIDGHTGEEIGYHVALMGEAGLIHVVPSRNTGYLQPFAAPLSITWQGHEFLAAAKNESTWRKSTSAVVAKAGAVGFELLKAVLIAELKRQLGI